MQYGSIFSSNMGIIEIEDFSSSFSKQAFLFFEMVAFSFSGWIGLIFKGIKEWNWSYPLIEFTVVYI